MLQSGLATRYKRTQWRFELVVECTGIDGQQITRRFVAKCTTNCRNHPVENTPTRRSRAHENKIPGPPPRPAGNIYVIFFTPNGFFEAFLMTVRFTKRCSNHTCMSSPVFVVASWLTLFDVCIWSVSLYVFVKFC